LSCFFSFTRANSRPLRPPSFSPGDSTPLIGALPLLTIEPIAFSTMFDSPPRLLPGVVFALRSGEPRFTYASYQAISQLVCEYAEACFDRCGQYRQIRLHGDFHPGNVLVAGDALHIVDLDDARSGPAIQDLWMFLSGNRQEQTPQLDILLDGYREFRRFDTRELNLIEALRTLRIMHYAAWLARRWEDPAFRIAFPWFNTESYWGEHILTLREQAAAMLEPPLEWRH